MATTINCDQCDRIVRKRSAGWRTVIDRQAEHERTYDFCSMNCLCDWSMQRATPHRKLTHDDFESARKMLATRRDQAVADAWDQHDLGAAS